MTRKRSKYRPSAVLANPLAPRVPIGKAAVTKYMLTYYTALNEIVSGNHPGRKEWCDLVDCCNIVERLMRRGSCSIKETLPVIKAASDEMRAIAKAFDESKVMRLSLKGFQAIQQLLEVQQQLMETFTLRDVEMVLAETRADIVEARRHKHVVML